MIVITSRRIYAFTRADAALQITARETLALVGKERWLNQRRPVLVFEAFHVDGPLLSLYEPDGDVT